MLMLASNPASAGIRCANGQNAVDLLWKRWVHPADYRALSINIEASNLRNQIGIIVNAPYSVSKQTRAQHYLMENPGLKCLWDAMRSFITAAKYGTTDVMCFKENRILHDCVELNCDPLLIQLAASLHCNQLRERVDGSLPIHLATKSSQALQTVLALHPPVASQPDASDGRLPLHLAVSNGITWKEGSLEALVQASPRALHVKDPVTGMFPVMMASDLDTIYNLLQANPSEPMFYALDKEDVY